MKIKVAEIARIVGGRVCGQKETVITGIAGIKRARKGDITFVANKRYENLIKGTKASAVVVSRDVDGFPVTLIQVDNPDLAFAKVADCFIPRTNYYEKGVHPSAFVGEDVTLGRDVSIGPNANLLDGCAIGDGSIICSGAYVGHESVIGENCLIYPNVVVRERVSVGNRCIIHSGTVIGSDGFGFTMVDGKHHKIPQIGTVEIGDDVEIGANVTIDRARFDKTVIKKGTKIDNLVQIAHNVVIGENSIVISLTAVAGSTTIGKNAILAGQVGVDGHLSVGDNVVIASRAGVTKNVPDNVVISGFPAQSHDKELRQEVCVRRLPQAMKRIHELEERIKELEQKAKDSGRAG
jgi:UDP-3-O-[3-hydroxymyristoyl] glucosamine N-acyltransferase